MERGVMCLLVERAEKRPGREHPLLCSQESDVFLGTNRRQQTKVMNLDLVLASPNSWRPVTGFDVDGEVEERVMCCWAFVTFSLPVSSTHVLGPIWKGLEHMRSQQNLSSARFEAARRNLCRGSRLKADRGA